MIICSHILAKTAAPRTGITKCFHHTCYSIIHSGTYLTWGRLLNLTNTPTQHHFYFCDHRKLLFLRECLEKRIQFKSPDTVRYTTIIFPPKNSYSIKTCFILQRFMIHHCLCWAAECRQQNLAYFKLVG